MKRSGFLVVLGSAAALAACSDQFHPVSPASSPDPYLEALVARGFRADRIEDMGDHFVVEGDIMIRKAELDAAPPPSRSPGHPGGPAYQWARFERVGTVRALQIRVDLSGTTSAWATATRAAMQRWLEVYGTRITFVEGSPADITVSMTGSLPSGTWARASWPSAAGDPGPTIIINQNMNPTADTKVSIMAHELGHTVGLEHSDFDGTVLISGTPTRDANSLMRSSVSGSAGWIGFSPYDRIALQTIYPLPAPSASVAYPGGTPTISWSPVTDAVSYTVQMIEETEWEDWSFQHYYDQWAPVVGTTTGTSVTDTFWTYTGVSGCSESGTPNYVFYRRSWNYMVTAHFPGGRSSVSAMLPAEIGAC